MATPDIGAAFRIRGGDPRDAAIAIDGLVIDGPFHFPALGGLLGIIDPRIAERVAVLAGGYPAEYGGRLGGLLEVVTLAPREAESEVFIGNSGARMRSQGRLGARTGWLVAGRFGDMHQRVDLAQTYEDIAPTYYDAFGKLLREVGTEGSLALHLLVAGDDIQARGGKAGGHFEGETRRAYGWLRFASPWGRRLWGRTVLALGEEERFRYGLAGDPNVRAEFPGSPRIGVELLDRRDSGFQEVTQDWVFHGHWRQSLKGGGACVARWGSSIIGAIPSILWDSPYMASAAWAHTPRVFASRASVWRPTSATTLP